MGCCNCRIRSGIASVAEIAGALALLEAYIYLRRGIGCVRTRDRDEETGVAFARRYSHLIDGQMSLFAQPGIRHRDWRVPQDGPWHPSKHSYPATAKLSIAGFSSTPELRAVTEVASYSWRYSWWWMPTNKVRVQLTWRTVKRMPTEAVRDGHMAHRAVSSRIWLICAMVAPLSPITAN